MKKFIIDLIILGVTGFSFAQDAHPNFRLSRFIDSVSTESDYDHTDEVEDGLLPNRVKFLENEVSKWDVTESKKFDSRKRERFSVTFRSQAGYIMVSYDSEGKMISAMGRFTNFALPKAIGKAVLRQYPNWRVTKNRYSVWYDGDGKTKRSFRLRIKKDNQKKWLRVDSSGNIS